MLAHPMTQPSPIMIVHEYWSLWGRDSDESEWAIASADYRDLQFCRTDYLRGFRFARLQSCKFLNNVSTA